MPLPLATRVALLVARRALHPPARRLALPLDPLVALLPDLLALLPLDPLAVLLPDLRAVLPLERLAVPPLALLAHLAEPLAARIARLERPQARAGRLHPERVAPEMAVATAARERADLRLEALRAAEAVGPADVKRNCR